MEHNSCHVAFITARSTCRLLSRDLQGHVEHNATVLVHSQLRLGVLASLCGNYAYVSECSRIFVVIMHIRMSTSIIAAATICRPLVSSLVFLTNRLLLS